MIRQFEKIENLGVFSNYSNPTDLPTFQRFNLIYGTNGSGKTTLSRFFDDLNNGAAEGFPNLKYRINTDDGKFTHGQAYVKPIRVFNSEYVDNNIGEIEGQLNPIFIIGEDNKTLAAQLESDESEYENLTNKIELEEKENLKNSKLLGKQFTDIARTISQDTAGTSSRTYNKKNAESAFSELVSPATLSAEKLALAMASLKESALEKITHLTPVPLVKLSVSEKSVDLLSALEILTLQTQTLVKESSTSTAIQALSNNPPLASWVEQGREIHNNEDKCQYCLQTIPDEREKALEQHFNESDKKLKSKILALQSDLNTINTSFDSFKLPLRSQFYKDKHQEFIQLKETFDLEIKRVTNHIRALGKCLNEKLSRRTESYTINLDCPEHKVVSETINSVQALIETTNAESIAYESRILQQQKLIETHHLSNVSDSIKELKKRVRASDKRLDIYKNGDKSDAKSLGSVALKSRIEVARAQLSNSHKGADDLSKKLASFLGRDDLKFVAEGEGYRIERFGRPAQKLSEGEKTAITFLHFVVGLNDQDFNLAEGIVVIDDPISSLDAASVYQAFGFLKVAVKDAKQIFLMTHNFDFLKLLLNWMKNGAKPKDVTYLMLKCTHDTTSRHTSICKLDAVLLSSNSEYQYLFKILSDFKSDGTVGNSYHIPNVVRKVLETFLGQHSTGGSLYKKLSNLDYDEQKKTALNKYANDLSHPTFSGIDPALVGETQTNVGIVLKMMEDVAPLHFKALVQNTL